MTHFSIDNEAIKDMMKQVTPSLPVSLPMVVGTQETIDALVRLEPGNSMIYHTGIVAIDRTRREIVHRLAKLAYKLHEEGRLHLFQRRHEVKEGFYYDYIAQGVRHVAVA